MPKTTKSTVLNKPNELISIISDKKITLIQRKAYNCFLKNAQNLIKFEDYKSNIFKIDAQTLHKKANIQKKDDAYIEKKLDPLMTTLVKIRNKDNPRLWKAFTLLSTIELKDDNCYYYELNHIVIQALREQTFFTPLNIFMINSLSSRYAIIFYELAIRYNKLKIPKMTIEEVRELTNTQEDYLRIFDFKRFVLDIACKEISEKTDINLSYTTEKKGRRIAFINFEISMPKKLEPIKTPKQETPPPAELLQQKEPSAAIEEKSDHKKFDIEEFKKLLDLITDKSLIIASLKQLLKNFLEIKGFEYCKYNLLYTLEKHQTKKLSNFNGYLRKALEVDFAKDTVKKLKKENQDKKLLDKIRNMSEDERNKITMDFFEQMNEDDKKYHFEQMKQDRQFAMILDENSKSGLQYVILKYAEVNFSFIDIAKKMGV